ncbi:hypothetical protein DICPUDRAFT_154484 [Dictyostelium purpureum]|uniref:Uncharacterized protein n=1 Tax=Dictyostelium purpureum TaxID=5786 RepID=F0ZRG1_DICPU|nr:uncharacterized protein DICPUDRAFT_154484 [Dictyostelium purpureum]EGC33483.1 hypothetical protein DICPUDRAFT_154484 [Dictyostelium purpureum]|eukprot:XP_003290006.1 hypothetical protein DICPUDRAFT_154484 [Dictyostelium purpureum]
MHMNTLQFISPGRFDHLLKDGTNKKIPACQTRTSNRLITGYYYSQSRYHCAKAGLFEIKNA